MQPTLSPLFLTGRPWHPGHCIRWIRQTQTRTDRHAWSGREL